MSDETPVESAREVARDYVRHVLDDVLAGGRGKAVAPRRAPVELTTPSECGRPYCAWTGVGDPA